MKSLKTIILILFALAACKKDNTQPKPPVIQVIKAGIIDSVNCYYKKYDPGLTQYENVTCTTVDCSQTQIDSFDIDNDKINDIQITTEFRLTNGNCHPYPYAENYINSTVKHYKKDFKLLNKSFSWTGPLSNGTEINSKLAWNTRDIEVQSCGIYNSPCSGGSCSSYDWLKDTTFLGFRIISEKDTIYACSRIIEVGIISDFQKDRK